MKSKIIITLLALFCASSTFAALPPRGTLVTDTIHSKILGTDREITIYLPGNFKSGDHFPVLYLLHGLSAKNDSWFKETQGKGPIDRLLTSGEAVPMVIVSPNAGGYDADKEQNGYFNMPGWKYEDFFFNELIPYIEQKYNCGGSKNQRAIAGLSMGGGGATALAQHHPEMFSSSYAMSALMALPEGREIPADPNNKVGKLFRAVEQNDCVNYVKNADDATRDALRTVNWFVDCGDDDFLLDVNINYIRAMKEAKIPVQFRVREGDHSHEYWHTALYYALPFASRSFK